MRSPVPRKLLQRSRWTARVPLPASDGERHFEVVAVPADRADVVVTLRAVLTHREYQVTIRALGDGERWQRGWQSIPLPGRTPPCP